MLANFATIASISIDRCFANFSYSTTSESQKLVNSDFSLASTPEATSYASKARRTSLSRDTPPGADCFTGGSVAGVAEAEADAVDTAAVCKAGAVDVVAA